MLPLLIIDMLTQVRGTEKIIDSDAARAWRWSLDCEEDRECSHGTQQPA